MKAKNLLLILVLFASISLSFAQTNTFKSALLFKKSDQRPQSIDHRKTNDKTDVRDHRRAGKRPVSRDHRRTNNSSRPSPPPRAGRLDQRDDDRDGIADSLEVEMANKFSPILRLPPKSKDWTRPANVDWYLQRV